MKRKMVIIIVKPEVIHNLLEINPTSKKELLKNYTFTLTDKIVYEVLDHDFPPDSDDTLYYEVGIVQAKDYELLVDLLSMYYTKIFDRKHYRLVTMFDYFDEKYTPKALPDKQDIDYGSNSEMLEEYKDHIKQLPKRDTREEKDFELKLYYENRLINYGEYLYFLGELELISNKSQILYTYIHKEFAGFFQWACGYFSNQEIEDLKQKYEPTHKSYINFISNLGPKNNKLQQILTKNNHIFLSQRIIEEKLEAIKQTKQYTQYLKRQKQKEFEEEKTFRKMNEQIRSSNLEKNPDLEEDETTEYLENAEPIEELTLDDIPREQSSINTGPDKKEEENKKQDKKEDKKNEKKNEKEEDKTRLINEPKDMENEDKKNYLDSLF